MNKMKVKRIEVGYALPRESRKDKGVFRVTSVDVDIGDPEWEKNAEIKTRIYLDDAGQEYEAIFSLGLAPGELEKVLQYIEDDND